MRFPHTPALLLLLLPATIAVACSEDDGNDANSFHTNIVDSGTTTPATDAAAMDDGGVHSSAEILHVVQTINTGEIAQGTLAQSKASSADVTSFAAMMVNEHTTANQRLATLAQQEGLTPQDNAVSQMLKSSADASTAQLQSLTGHAFDVAYIDAQVLMHKMALDTIDGQLIPNATDAAVKSELTTTRASVEMHYTHAQMVKQSIASDAGADAGDGGADHH